MDPNQYGAPFQGGYQGAPVMEGVDQMVGMHGHQVPMQMGAAGIPVMPVEQVGGAAFPAAPPQQGSRQVFVGNLSWSLKWQDLKDHFREVGNVLYTKIMQDERGRSKGCGIVEFETVEEAQQAIAQMNNREIDGRTIFVREDNKYSSGGGGAPPQQQHYAPRGPAPGMGMSGERNPGNPNGTKVFVGNLSWATRWQGLKDHMRQAGNVLHADIMMESGGRSKGCAIVEYATPEEAANAIATLADTNLDGRPIFVREDRRGRP